MVLQRSDRWRCRARGVLLLVLSTVVLGHSAAVAQQSEPSAVPAPSPGTTTALDSGAAPPALAFEGVTVVDVRDGRLHAQQTVVVVGNHIRAVGRARRVPIPAGARVIRADGTYLIPGLWDMHVHTWGFPRTSYPLFIANGVTGVREMSATAPDSVPQWRREILAGTRVGPRVVTAGPAVYDTSMRHFDWRFGHPWGVFAGTPAEGRRVVDSLQAAGADFIKVYDGHSREVYFAIAAEARRMGIPFGGHQQASVSAIETSDSGQHSIEHYLACDTSTKGGVLHNSFNPQECPALAARFRRNDTWFSIAAPSMPALALLNPVKDPMRYWPDSVLVTPYDSMRYDSNYMVGGRSLEEWAAAHRDVEKWTAQNNGVEPIFGKLHRAGIRLLAGTDPSPVAFTLGTVPGFSLHDLLWTLVRAGLTPLEALQTTTLNPAEYFHATDTLGTIAPGKLADFVLLDANPLVDIYNTRRIRAVVANGRFFDRGTWTRCCSRPNGWPGVATGGRRRLIPEGTKRENRKEHGRYGAATE